MFALDSPDVVRTSCHPREIEDGVLAIVLRFTEDFDRPIEHNFAYLGTEILECLPADAVQSEI
jgi:hypothetical protein